jgi:hypothetical protein
MKLVAWDDLQLGSYLQSFIDPVINSKGSHCPSREEKCLGSVYSPYVKDGCFGEDETYMGSNHCNIRAIIKTKTLLGVHSWKPGQKEISNRQLSVSSISCECGRSYTGETGRPSHAAPWICTSLKDGLLEKSKLDQYAYEESYKVGWDECRTWK